MSSSDSVMPSDLDRLQEIIRVRFEDQTLLRRALVHRSYLNENPEFDLPSNERLEFLGDALLDFVVGEYLYRRFSDMDEGDLTSMRSALIKSSTLAEFARIIGLGEYVYVSRGEDERGGRSRVGLLADAFEALVAAMYLDRGMKVVAGFLREFLEPEIARVLEDGLERDYKSRLQEWSQREARVTPVYCTIMERGPDHAKEFTVEVLIGDRTYGSGKGRSKQAAEQRAAQRALEEISRRGV